MKKFEAANESANELGREGLNVNFLAWRVLNKKDTQRRSEVKKLYNMRARQRPVTKH